MWNLKTKVISVITREAETSLKLFKIYLNKFIHFHEQITLNMNQTIKIAHYYTDTTQEPPAKFDQNLYTAGVSNLIWQITTVITGSLFVG